MIVWKLYLGLIFFQKTQYFEVAEVFWTINLEEGRLTIEYISPDKFPINSIEKRNMEKCVTTDFEQ